MSTDLLRYFQIRKTWDLRRYTSLTEADLIFRNQAKTRFTGQRSNISISDGRWDALRIQTSVRTSAVASLMPPWASLLKCFPGLRYPRRNLSERGEEGRDYTLHLGLHLSLHPVAPNNFFQESRIPNGMRTIRRDADS